VGEAGAEPLERLDLRRAVGQLRGDPVVDVPIELGIGEERLERAFQGGDGSPHRDGDRRHVRALTVGHLHEPDALRMLLAERVGER
jgi:hypothetical protein